MMGLDRVHLSSAAATLVEPLRKAAGLTEFVRCRLQGSPDDVRGALDRLRRARARCARCRSATALIVGPAETTQLDAGARVRVVLLGRRCGRRAAVLMAGRGSSLRIGQGWDIHRLVDRAGRCMLGGVHVPHARGLLGHSDGDAVLHARGRRAARRHRGRRHRPAVSRHRSALPRRRQRRAARRGGGVWSRRAAGASAMSTSPSSPSSPSWRRTCRRCARVWPRCSPSTRRASG